MGLAAAVVLQLVLLDAPASDLPRELVLTPVRMPPPPPSSIPPKPELPPAVSPPPPPPSADTEVRKVVVTKAPDRRQPIVGAALEVIPGVGFAYARSYAFMIPSIGSLAVAGAVERYALGRFPASNPKLAEGILYGLLASRVVFMSLAAWRVAVVNDYVTPKSAAAPKAATAP